MRYQFSAREEEQPTRKSNSGSGVETLGRHPETVVATGRSVWFQRCSLIRQRSLPAEVTRISPSSDRVGAGCVEPWRDVENIEVTVEELNINVFFRFYMDCGDK